MEASAKTADILIAATHVDERILGCLAQYRATHVRTFDDAKRALRERAYRLLVIDLNFDGVRTFDLLQYVRSLPGFERVPVVCLQTAEPGAGFASALDRLVRSVGGRAFIDLRAEGEKFTQALEYFSQIAATELRSGVNGARCVLIIDDDCDAAHQLGNVLEYLGHDVDYAYDQVAGLDAARRLRPDVVFLALGSAGIDEVELARHLRHGCGPSKPYVVGIAKGRTERPANPALDSFLAQPISAVRIQNLLERLR